MWLLLILLAVALAYNLIVIWAAENYHCAPVPPIPATLPPISIFKPLHGGGDWLYGCLASFARLDYPEFEILCCAARADDPSLEIARRVARDFPSVPIRILVADRIHGANAKMDGLDQMFREMRYGVMALSDDDILVEPGDMRRIAAELRATDGVVTCPYRAIPGATFPSAMEALGIAGEFFGGAFVARKMEGVRFAMGSMIVVRKECVAEFGGFPVLADYLADDYELGARIAAHGHRNVMSSVVVATQLPPDTWASMLAHQFRWMRTQAISRPGGHIGLGATYGSVWAIAALAWQPHSTVVLALAMAWAASRCASVWWTGARVLGDPVVKRWWWLAPLRELLTASLWLLSLFRRTVIWRGERFRTVGGQLVR